MDVETLQTTTSDGRSVTIWRSAPPEGSTGPVVVLGAGFGRRMRHVGAAALYLVHAGATVYRYDSIDHVGLSHGEIFDFTMTAAHESLAAVVDHAHRIERRPVALVAVSLMARPAFRLAAATETIDRVVTLVGVVNLRSTLTEVLGRDLGDVPVSELPPTLTVEGHEVDARRFAADVHGGDWGSLACCSRELAALDRPACAFYAENDIWVTEADIVQAFSPRNAPRVLAKLPYGEHDLSRNPVALRTVLGQLTRAATAPAELIATALTGDAAAGPEPSFEDVVQLAIDERKLEQALATNAPAPAAAI